VAIISQHFLFRWQEIEELGDLERLQLLVNNLPDENLMLELELGRANGRNDYPLRPLWNSFLAGQVFQHASIESLRRELKRNGQLRQVCGFDPCRGLTAVPPSYVYTRFLKLLFSCHEQVDQMFADLVAELQELLPDFGKVLAIDGKAIQSHGNSRSENADNTPDGRRDVDANWGTKTYKGKKADGTAWSKTKHWFGYKMHLIVDATYELPVAFGLTKASAPEQPTGLALIKDLADDHPDLINRCEYFLGDKGYDGTKYHTQLWDGKHKIKSVIDIRNLWKDGEDEHIVTGCQNVAYDYCGNVYCYCMKTGKRQDMAYGGFEKDRDSLKYRCPAKHYGLKCKSLGSCKVGHSVRIKLSEDRRVFTPVARSSYLWKSLYKMRTSVERINGRLDTSFGFEDHYIRGQKKMELRVGLALVVMLAMAAGRIKQKRPELMRSLVGDAA
jgi:hypothetical protein